MGRFSGECGFTYEFLSIYDAQLERKETLAIFPCFVCFKGNGTDFNLSCADPDLKIMQYQFYQYYHIS
jgi:hypothetical protein